MLIEFRCENHRSIREEQALSMEAGRIGDASDPRARGVPGHAEKLLTVAALYGANASGKSNFLRALDYMASAVVLSHRAWSPDGGIRREPFLWDGWAVKPSLFEVTFVIDGVRYQYGFVTGDQRFEEEWVYAWPRGKKQVWYEREGDQFHCGEHLRGEIELIKRVTRPNALFLSTSAQHQHPQLSSLYLWFSRIRYLALAGSIDASGPVDWLCRRFLERGNTLATAPFISDGEPEAATLLQFWRDADLDIVDVRLAPQGIGSPFHRALELRHASADSPRWLPLTEESRGTQAFLDLSLWVVRALWYGLPLVVDELEASLHPLLVRSVIRHFQHQPQASQRLGQLIFTTHNSTLLGGATEPLLRRDQIWLTEKNPEGATVLYPLTDFKPRKVENLERGYLQGRFGAVPFLSVLGLEQDATANIEP